MVESITQMLGHKQVALCDIPYVIVLNMFSENICGDKSRAVASLVCMYCQFAMYVTCCILFDFLKPRGAKC